MSITSINDTNHNSDMNTDDNYDADEKNLESQLQTRMDMQYQENNNKVRNSVNMRNGNVDTSDDAKTIGTCQSSIESLSFIFTSDATSRSSNVSNLPAMPIKSLTANPVSTARFCKSSNAGPT